MGILRNLLLVGQKKPPSSIKEKFHLATNSGLKMKTFNLPSVGEQTKLIRIHSASVTNRNTIRFNPLQKT